MERSQQRFRMRFHERVNIIVLLWRNLHEKWIYSIKTWPLSPELINSVFNSSVSRNWQVPYSRTLNLLPYIPQNFENKLAENKILLRSVMKVFKFQSWTFGISSLLSSNFTFLVTLIKLWKIMKVSNSVFCLYSRYSINVPFFFLK